MVCAGIKSGTPLNVLFKRVYFGEMNKVTIVEELFHWTDTWYNVFIFQKAEAEIE